MLIATEIQTRGRNLGILASTENGPPVLFFHGNSGSAELFRPLLSSAALRGFKPIAVNFAGHGTSRRSSNPENDYCVPGLAASIVDLVQELKLERYVLVGHSLGGHAVATALPKLKGAAGVMLSSAPPINLQTMSQAFKPDPTDGAMFQAELSAPALQRFRDALLASGTAVAPAVQSALTEGLQRTDERFRPALLASILAGRIDDERANIENTPVPSCLVFGRRDPFLNGEYADTLALRAPFAGGVHHFDASGHSPHLDAPEQFGALLRRFLEETLSKSAPRSQASI